MHIGSILGRVGIGCGVDEEIETEGELPQRISMRFYGFIRGREEADNRLRQNIASEKIVRKTTELTRAPAVYTPAVLVEVLFIHSGFGNRHNRPLDMVGDHQQYNTGNDMVLRQL